MLTILEAVAMPPGADGAREVRHFAYTSDADNPANLGGSVRDGNNALDIVRQLVGKSETRGETSWYEGEPPRSRSQSSFLRGWPACATERKKKEAWNDLWNGLWKRQV